MQDKPWGENILFFYCVPMGTASYPLACGRTVDSEIAWSSIIVPTPTLTSLISTSRACSSCSDRPYVSASALLTFISGSDTWLISDDTVMSSVFPIIGTGILPLVSFTIANVILSTYD